MNIYRVHPDPDPKRGRKRGRPQTTCMRGGKRLRKRGPGRDGNRGTRCVLRRAQVKRNWKTNVKALCRPIGAKEIDNWVIIITALPYKFKVLHYIK